MLEETRKRRIEVPSRRLAGWLAGWLAGTIRVHDHVIERVASLSFLSIFYDV